MQPIKHTMVTILLFTVAGCVDSTFPPVESNNPPVTPMEPDNPQTMSPLVTFSESVMAADGAVLALATDELTLTIPAGALESDTEISIRRLEADTLEPTIEGAIVDFAYEFGPDGTQFSQDAQILLALPNQVSPTSEIVGSFVSIESNNGDIDLPEVTQAINLDDGSQSLEIPLSHFSTLQSSSRLQNDSLPFFTVSYEDIPDTVATFIPFEITELSTLADLQISRRGPDLSENFELRTSVRSSATSDTVFDFDLTLVCLEVGLQKLTLSTDVILGQTGSDRRQKSTVVLSKNINCLPVTDTDNDGLDDEFEYDNDLDPTREDTDGNNIPDSLEDPDEDGLTNEEEMRLGTNPYDKDTDGDTLSDSDELDAGLDPLLSDSDSNGIDDAADDNDQDTVENSIEILLGLNPFKVDSDGDGDPDNEEDNDSDGIPDAYEVRNGLDPEDGGDNENDEDGDGLINQCEFIVETNPNIKDTDGDSITDDQEDFDGDGLHNAFECVLPNSLSEKLSAVDADTDGDNILDGVEDEDMDGLTNLQEQNLGTNYLVADTDEGGVNDGTEVSDGTDPLLAFDDQNCPSTHGIDETIPTGLHDVPQGAVTRLESLNFAFDHSAMQAGNLSTECSAEPVTIKPPTPLITPAFAGFTNIFIAGIAFEDNWGLFDLVTNQVVDLPHFFEFINYQYAAAFAQQSAVNQTMIVAGGVGKVGFFGALHGEIKRHDGDTDTITGEDLFEQSFGIQSVGGQFATEDVLIAETEAVTRRNFTAGDATDLFQLSALGFPGFATDGQKSAQIVAAYQQQNNGPILVLLTDELGDQDEDKHELYTVDPGTGLFQKFAGTGLQQNSIVRPRQVRCSVPLCITSHFGGTREDGSIDPGGLSILQWSGSGDHTDGTIVSLVPLGTDVAPSGVVGIDIISDGAGNHAVAAAGFTSGILYETVFDEAGNIVRSANQPAPVGCSEPGHVRYLVDNEGLKLVGTCFNSSNYFVTRSELQ